MPRPPHMGMPSMLMKRRVPHSSHRWWGVLSPPLPGGGCGGGGLQRSIRKSRGRLHECVAYVVGGFLKIMPMQNGWCSFDLVLRMAFVVGGNLAF
jgi:hypothetical protein